MIRIRKEIMIENSDFDDLFEKYRQAEQKNIL
jgi:hypothetical protein